MGSGNKVIYVNLGEIKINADFIESIIVKFQELIDPEAPIVLGFKRAYFLTGHDLEQFIEALGIEFEPGEVAQK